MIRSFSIVLPLILLLIGSAGQNDGPYGTPWTELSVSDTLAPGDARLNTGIVQPYRRRYTIDVVHNGERRRMGTMIDDLRMVKSPDGPVFERIQTTETPGGVQIDSVRASASTLSPHSHVSRSPVRAVDLTFTSEKISGVYAPFGAEDISVHEDIERPVFDSNWIDIVIRTLPLEVGFDATVPTYERSSADPVEAVTIYDVQVIERTVLELDGRVFDVFVVEAQVGGGLKTQFHIGTADRQLLKIETSPGPGMQMVIEWEPPTTSGLSRSLLGLRTAKYYVADLERAKLWYADVLGSQPYFDEPFYVGFNVGGYELGLMPADELWQPGVGGSAVYWAVEDANVVFDSLVEMGASPFEVVEDVGGGIRLGTVVDPFGNVLGVIENPHFKRTQDQ